ncbi:hypothetical protein PENSPDRAFT_654310 [Peniophora sp. CONT]|nr:hypothetical protein PENSPDRAFT_654310 [Peniophora sp. CONT]
MFVVRQGFKAPTLNAIVLGCSLGGPAGILVTPSNTSPAGYYYDDLLVLEVASVTMITSGHGPRTTNCIGFIPDSSVGDLEKHVGSMDDGKHNTRFIQPIKYPAQWPTIRETYAMLEV